MDHVNVPESVKKIWEWFTFADYELAKEEGRIAVTLRFTRGNVVMQNGWMIEKDGLDELTKKGDKAMKFLIEKMPVA